MICNKDNTQKCGWSPSIGVEDSRRMGQHFLFLMNGSWKLTHSPSPTHWPTPYNWRVGYNRAKGSGGQKGPEGKGARIAKASEGPRD